MGVEKVTINAHVAIIGARIVCKDIMLLIVFVRFAIIIPPYIPSLHKEVYPNLECLSEALV